MANQLDYEAVRLCQYISVYSGGTQAYRVTDRQLLANCAAAALLRHT